MVCLPQRFYTPQEGLRQGADGFDSHAFRPNYLTARFAAATKRCRIHADSGTFAFVAAFSISFFSSVVRRVYSRSSSVSAFGGLPRFLALFMPQLYAQQIFGKDLISGTPVEYLYVQ